MSFPANAGEMRKAGYRFLEFGVCDGCNAMVEWWQTPKGLQIPINPMPATTSSARPHWAICPEVLRPWRKEAVSKKNRGGK
jgi:hypothetical protein